MTARPSPEVALDVLAPVAVDTAYSYRAPSEWKLEPGQCVRMPLGTRMATGVVWAVRPGGGDNLKAIAATLDWPPLRAPLRDFIDWVARWTLSPRGMVPVAYNAEKDGTAWFCGCKQSKNAPLCDGTHRSL